MIGYVGVHGANDAQIICMCGGFFEEFTDGYAAFAVLFEFEGGAERAAGRPLRS